MQRCGGELLHHVLGDRERRARRLRRLNARQLHHARADDDRADEI